MSTFDKVIAVIVSLCIVVFIIKFKIDTSSKSMNQEKENGYKVGLIEGKQKAEEDYSLMLEQEKKEFEKILANDKTEYEKKVSVAYETGLQQGIEQMTKDIEAVVTIKDEKDKKTKQKKAKKKWNAIISR